MSDNWIDVKDKLPELHKEVFVYSSKNKIRTQCHLVINGPDAKGKHCVMWAGGLKVSHWQSMPEPPEDNN